MLSWVSPVLLSTTCTSCQLYITYISSVANINVAWCWTWKIVYIRSLNVSLPKNECSSFYSQKLNVQHQPNYKLFHNSGQFRTITISRLSHFEHIDDNIDGHYQHIYCNNGVVHIIRCVLLRVFVDVQSGPEEHANERLDDLGAIKKNRK